LTPHENAATPLNSSFPLQYFEDTVLKACVVIGYEEGARVPIGRFREILGTLEAQSCQWEPC
jgi:hypothetical protein